MNDAPRGPDWRATTPPTARRGPHPLVAVVGLCALAAAGLGLLVWVQPARTATVLCVASTSLSDDSPVPFASADFARVTGEPLRRPSFALPLDPTRDQLRTALAAMARHPVDQPLVLFLTGAASVNEGEIELGAGVPGADHGRNRVTLTEVLEQLRAVKSAHKLLVLDLHTPLTDWVQPARKCLENVTDPNRLVLFAHGTGEESHFSGGSVFVRYWLAGLRGAADANRDSRVSVTELAAFVRASTHRWAEQNRTTPQTPWLTGDGADFVLAPVSTTAAEEPEPTPDPAKVLEAWAVQDAWMADGRADRAPVPFAALQRALLNMERDWQAGKSPDDARRAFDAESGNITAADPILPEVLNPTPSPDPVTVEVLRRYLVRAEAVAEPAEKPPVVTAPVILAVASADPPPSAVQLKRLAKLLAEVEPESTSVASLLLRRLAAEAVAPDRAARLVRTTLEFEALGKLVEFFVWGQAGLDRAFGQWSTTVALTCSPTHANPADTDRALAELEATLRTLTVAADAHRTAVNALRRGERVLSTTDTLDPLPAALTPPDPSPDLHALATAANKWAKLAAEVDTATRAATAPYQLPALAAVRRKATGADAGPHELADVDRVLTFPLIPAKERVELWGVRLALAKRLDDATRERDRQDDDDFKAGRGVPITADPREVPVPLSWFRIATTRPAPTVFNTPRNELLAWHTARFDHLSRNPIDLPNATAEGAYFTRALDSCRQLGATVPTVPRLEIQADSLTLTPAKRSGVVGVSVRLIGSERQISTAVDVLTPSTEWLTTPPAGAVELSPVRAVVAERSLAVGTHPEKFPMLAGVLVRCEVGGRVYFKRVAVDTGSLSNRLELLVSTDAKTPPLPATSLRVRPNGQPAKFALVLSNPTTAPQTVIVQLTSPTRETPAITLEPGEKKPLAFPAPPPPVTPPATPAPEFDTAPAEFVIHLLQPKTRQVRQSFSIPVRVTEPAELLDVREVLYSPTGELTANVGERSTFAGGDMPVSLMFPEDRNRGLSVTDGKLSGVFTPGQGVLKLYAKRLKFEPSGGRTVTLAVTADGVQRAFTFAGEASGDAAVRFMPLTAPRVSIRADDFATGTAPLWVNLETDNAPPTATVEVSVGTEADGKFVADFTRRDVPAKTRTVGVAFDPKGGLTLRATVSDPEPKVPVDKLVGRRVVLARLLDANRTELARDRKVVVFDGRKPQEVRFLDPPAKVAADKPLSVKAACDLPVSGVKEVHFFTGKPANDAPPPNAMLIAAKPADGRNEWVATLQLDGAKGPLDVSVRFTSNSGLVGFATVSIERADAADINKPEPASVKGRVVVGDLAQPRLTVVLSDDKGQEKATAKTKDDGTFAFADLPPGNYTLSATKTAGPRLLKKLPVELKAGEEKVVELGLLLK